MASKAYLDLQERVKASADPFSLFNECSDYIQGILFDGMSGSNEFFQAYCAYAFSMGVEFTPMDGAPMAVSMDTSTVGETSKGVGGISFLIDPLQTVIVFNSEFEVLFCIGHEVKHLLLKHLLKYKDLYKEETTGVILNLCNDVEVNESLKSELTARGYIGSGSYPNSCFDLDSISTILGGIYTKEYLNKVYYKVRHNMGYDSLSDMLYKFFDVKCKDVLGLDIEEILYYVQVAKSSFKAEIFNTADYGTSSVFKIKDPVEAKRFCFELSKYLKRCKFHMIAISGGFGTDSASGSSGDSGKESEGEGSGSGEGEGDGSGEGSSSGGSGSGKGNGSQKGSGKGVSEKDVKSNSSICSADQMMDSGTMQSILSALEDLKDTYLKGISSKLGQKGRGVGSGGKIDLELKDFKTTIPWQVMLKRYLTSLSQEKVYTKKRINRRQPNRLELSGVKFEPTLTLIVAFDESSSISPNESSYFFSEFAVIAKQYHCDVHLYRFTSQIEEYTYIRRKDVARKLKSGSITSYRYSGGTSFQPVFDAVQENKRIKLNRSVLVMFTDGFGEPNVEFGRVKNRLWVVTRSKDNKDFEISCPEAERNVYPVVPIRK